MNGFNANSGYVMRIGHYMRASLATQHTTQCSRTVINPFYIFWFCTTHKQFGIGGNHCRNAMFNVAKENNQIARTSEWSSNLINRCGNWICRSVGWRGE